MSPNGARPPTLPPRPSRLTNGRADPGPPRQGHLRRWVLAGAVRPLAPLGGDAAPGEGRARRAGVGAGLAAEAHGRARRLGRQVRRECGHRAAGTELLRPPPGGCAAVRQRRANAAAPAVAPQPPCRPRRRRGEGSGPGGEPAGAERGWNSLESGSGGVCDGAQDCGLQVGGGRCGGI